MKSKIHILGAGLFALALASASAIAQPFPYAGSDNFDDNSLSPSWDFGYAVPGTTSGLFTETNSRLEFTSTSANQSRALAWNNSVNNAYSESWTASLDVANFTTPTTGYTLIGLQVFAANDLDLGLFGIYAYSSATNGQRILVESGVGPTYALTSYFEGANPADLSDVTLRMSHDALTHDVSFSFSLDGGTSFTTAGTVFNPGTDWSGNPTDGFSFRLLALSTSGAIAANQMYADNFAVSAVPEPSTYAALAGLGVLGLVFWRKRRR